MARPAVTGGKDRSGLLRLVGVVICLFVGAGLGPAGAQDRPALMVLPANINSAVDLPKSLHRVLTQAVTINLEGALRDQRAFDIYTKEDIALTAIQEERLRQITGDFDTSLIEEGDLKLVELIVVPIIWVADMNRHVRDLAGGQTVVQDYGTMQVQARVLNTQSGKVEASMRATESLEFQPERLFDRSGNWRQVSQLFLSELSVATTRALGARLIQAIFPPKVAAVSGDTVWINKGEGSGLEIGQEYDIFALGDCIVDPDTGECLQEIETWVGRARIERINAKVSAAKLVDGEGSVPRGAVLRPRPES